MLRLARRSGKPIQLRGFSGRSMIVKSERYLLRGGSWTDETVYVASAAIRDWFAPLNSFYFVGFWCAI
jgi:xanthine dehydrogenase iron-sulfur cluster and FAD-binding subunit A